MLLVVAASMAFVTFAAATAPKRLGVLGVPCRVRSRPLRGPKVRETPTTLTSEHLKLQVLTGITRGQAPRGPPQETANVRGLREEARPCVALLSPAPWEIRPVAGGP